MKHLLTDAKQEIVSLRHENEILRSKVFALVLHTKPAYRSQGMGEDVICKINKQLENTAKEDNGHAHELELEAAIREMILSLPGGQSCDPQKIADTLRGIAQRHGVTVE